MHSHNNWLQVTFVGCYLFCRFMRWRSSTGPARTRRHGLAGNTIEGIWEDPRPPFSLSLSKLPLSIRSYLGQRATKDRTPCSSHKSHSRRGGHVTFAENWRSWVPAALNDASLPKRRQSDLNHAVFHRRSLKKISFI